MRALEHFNDYIDKLAPAVKRVRFVGLVAGFGIVAVGNNFRGSTVAWQAEHAATIFWVGLTVLLLTNFALIFIDKQAVEILKSLHLEEQRAEVLVSENQALERYQSELVAWLTLTKLISELVDQALEERELDEEHKQRIFDAAVEFIAEHKGRLFGIGDDYLNISLYRFNDASQQLDCIACYRSRPSDARESHRSWRIGEGHVGKAFELQRELVCSDARVPDVAAWIAAPPDKEREEDTERYVSLLAVPISLRADDPLGVLIMTSDVPGRFVNQSEAEVTEIDPSDHGRYAVAALQDIAAQLAQLMCILKANQSR